MFLRTSVLVACFATGFISTAIAQTNLPNPTDSPYSETFTPEAIHRERSDYSPASSEQLVLESSAYKNKAASLSADHHSSCVPDPTQTELLIDAIFGDRPLLADLRNQRLMGSDLYASVGGQLRYRYMDERNRLRPQGNLRRNTYNLWRFTPFAEIGNSHFKAYVQAIDAVSFGEDLPTVPIDENRADLLQYYLDLSFIEIDGIPVHLRYGRQFLKYGSQHLVSPLGWSNTFRNFEGSRTYWENQSWSFESFAVRPVNGAGGAIPHPFSNDIPDQSVWFRGMYASYKNAPYGTFDIYWMWLDEDERKLNRHDGNRHTIGLRYAGKNVIADACGNACRTYFWDVDGAWQFGEDSFQNGGANQDVFAGFVFAEAGVTWHTVAWQPTIKGLFWWGSGDSNPNDGDVNTLTTLYPFGHYYWGLIDNFNGANLLDYSIQASVKPTRKLTFAAAWHWFDKANRNDHIYNIVGAPLGPVGGPRHIGHELDLTANYVVSKNLSLQLGYFWFWYGKAVNNTAISRKDAQQAYFMATWGY